MNDSFDLKLYFGPLGLQELAAEWQVLISKSSNRFFHRLEWHDCYLNAVEEDPNSVVYCAFYRSDVLALIVPLRVVARRLYGVELRCLELLQHDHMWLTDVVMSDNGRGKISARSVISALKRCSLLRWDVIVMRHVLEDSFLTALEAAGSAPLTVSKPRSQCDYLPVRPWEQLHRELSSNARKNLRNAANHLTRKGEATYVSAPGSLDLATALGEFLAMEASGWKGAAGAGTAIQLSPGLVRFYQSLTERFCGNCGCEIHLLRLNGKAIAGMFTVLAGETSYFLKCAYDEEYARLSPVHLLIQHTLKQYALNGAPKVLNFVSSMAWPDVWKPHKMPVADHYFWNTKLIGMVGYLAMKAERALRGCRRKGNTDAAF